MTPSTRAFAITAAVALMALIAALAVVHDVPKFVPVDFCAVAPAPCR